MIIFEGLLLLANSLFSFNLIFEYFLNFGYLRSLITHMLKSVQIFHYLGIYWIKNGYALKVDGAKVVEIVSIIDVSQAVAVVIATNDVSDFLNSENLF